MFEIQRNGAVTINRGDSFVVALYINKGSVLRPVRYHIDDNTTVKFKISPPNCDFPIIEKTFDVNSDTTEDGDIIISISPDEMTALKKGKYYYSAVVLIGDERCVIIPEKEFFVL